MAINDLKCIMIEGSTNRIKIPKVFLSSLPSIKMNHEKIITVAKGSETGSDEKSPKIVPKTTIRKKLFLLSKISRTFYYKSSIFDL